MPSRPGTIEAEPAVIEENDKFALVALRVGGASAFQTAEVAPGLWVASEPFLPLTTPWRDWLGTIRVDQIERCNLFLLTRLRSASPGVLDQETRELENRAWRGYLALLLARLFATSDPPLMVSGARQGTALSIQQVTNLPQPVHDALGMPGRFDAADIHRAGEIAAAMAAYDRARPAGGCWRFNRVVSLYAATRAILEMVDRIHQYTRCLDGLTVPPIKGGTAKNFADRVALFVGAENRAIFQRLYALRGEIEHLHENRYLETFDRAIRLGLMKDAGVLEYVVRACIGRIMATPELWLYFCGTTALETFWALPEPQRRLLWGPPINPMLALSGFNEAWVRDVDLGGA